MVDRASTDHSKPHLLKTNYGLHRAVYGFLGYCFGHHLQEIDCRTMTAERSATSLLWSIISMQRDIISQGVLLGNGEKKESMQKLVNRLPLKQYQTRAVPRL